MTCKFLGAKVILGPINTNFCVAFWRVICGAAVARCFYGFGAEISGRRAQRSEQRTSRATKLSLSLSLGLLYIMECCVCFYGFKGSITCCSLLLIEDGARGQAHFYTHTWTFSHSGARRDEKGWPAGALFSPLLGKGVD
jgi:hypothetical protein